MTLIGIIEKKSDVELISIMRQNEPGSVEYNNAFDSLYNKHFDAVFRFANWKGEGRNQAEDITQATFLKFLEKGLEQFRGTCLVSSYLCEIAKNTAKNELKWKKRQSYYITVADLRRLKKAQQDSPEELNMKNSLNEALYRAIDTLPSVQKESILAVLKGEGQKYDEIAEELGVPLGTLKTRVFYGRDKLKKKRALAEMYCPA